MKTIKYFILILFSPVLLFGQTIAEHQGISLTNIDVTTETTVGQITINPTVAGKVIVHFDGKCVSSPGDRIVLAASDTPSWNVNDGNVGVEAVNGDFNRNSFSHTRVYDVNAGSHTFYAIAHNFVETDGDGIASIYASLTVEFFPANTNMIVAHQGISETNIDVNNETTVGQVTINPAVAGKVIVHFDGKCVSSPGDRIVLAASDTPSWNVNDGNVGVEAIDSDLNRNSFSHTRVYDVNAGSHTFYAIAHNFVETDGDGIASVYASLTVEFVAATNAVLVAYQGISETNIDVNNETTVGQVTINPTVTGKVIVHFDGKCVSSPGDRIVLAASDTPSWNVNDGNIGVEAIDSDLNRNSFSHTRGYDVNPGSHTFYAVAHNFVETDGDGIASIYASLTVKFIPDETLSAFDFEEKEQLVFYPNPTNGIVHISNPSGHVFEKTHLRILDSSGRILQTMKAAILESGFIDLSGYVNGMYFIQVINKDNTVVKEEKIIRR